MHRRDFITLLGGAAAWPLAARAQQAAMPRVGYLSSTAIAPRLAELRKGLNDTGYFEGRNLAIEFHAADRYDQLPAMAADLVRRRVAVIVANSLPAAVAAKGATTEIPIVFFIGGDPVKAGLVTSLNRPGGNLTGVTNLNSDLMLKRFELLRELVPKASLITTLVNPTNPNANARISVLQDAARSVGQKISILNARREDEFATAFAEAVQEGAAAALIVDDPFFGVQAEKLAALALSHMLPAISFSRPFVAAGGLMAYAVTPGQVWPQIASYVGRILKGEKPADLPVVQGSRFALVINLKTAKALGLDVPPGLLAIADEVIE